MVHEMFFQQCDLNVDQLDKVNPVLFLQGIKLEYYIIDTQKCQILLL